MKKSPITWLLNWTTVNLLVALCFLSACSKPSEPSIEKQEAIEATPLPLPESGEASIEPPARNAYTPPQYEYVATTKLPELDESTIVNTIFINAGHPQASDKNSGTEDAPLKTINGSRRAMMSSLQAGDPVKIVIAPGVYRESLLDLFNFRGASEKARTTLLVVEGSSAGDVIITGSQNSVAGQSYEASTWMPVDGEPGLYWNHWNQTFELQAGPWINTYGFAMLPGVLQRSEMIWLDGRHLRQVLTESYEWVDPDGHAGTKDYGTGATADTSNQPGKLVYSGMVEDHRRINEPWTFGVYLDPATPEKWRNKIFVRLPADKTMHDFETIEVSHFNRLFSPLVRINNKENFILRNLTVTRNTSGPLGSTFIVSQCKNFMVEDCEVSENVGPGLAVNRSQQGVLRRVVANNNGGNGMGIGESSSEILVDQCETSFNNYRGAWAGFVGWHASAFKCGAVTNITIRNHASIGNYANGLWFDVYCKDILTENSFFLGNQRNGLMYELTRPKGGPQIVRNSVFFKNTGANIYISMSANSRVEDNLILEVEEGGFIENEASQTLLLYKFRNHPQGPKSAEDWVKVTVQNNIFATNQGNIVNILRKKSDSKDFDRILKVLEGGNNQYWSASPENAFVNTSAEMIDFSAWQAQLTQYNPTANPDANSRWEAITFAKNAHEEFLDTTQSFVTQRARDMGVPLPQESIREYWNRVTTGGYEPPYLFWTRQYD